MKPSTPYLMMYVGLLLMAIAVKPDGVGGWRMGAYTVLMVWSGMVAAWWARSRRPENGGVTTSSPENGAERR